MEMRPPQTIYWAGMVVGLLSVPFFALIVPQIAAFYISINELRRKPDVTWPSKLGIIGASVASIIAALILLRFLSVLIWPVN